MDHGQGLVDECHGQFGIMNISKEHWDRIQDIFHKALAIEDHEQRENYLVELDVVEEISGQVRQLLAVHVEASSFLEENAYEDFDLGEDIESGGMSEDSSAHSSRLAQDSEGGAFPGTERKMEVLNSRFKEGTEVGNYVLGELIGKGGMGEVYSATQEHPLKRTVALKLIHSEGAESSVMRFRREYQLLAQLKNEHIAQVYDAGTTSEGCIYFTMELVEGETLSAYVSRYALSVDEITALIMQVCDGLQYAHQKGILHRDIKPSNILVSTEGALPVCKIIDFGIAKEVQGDREHMGQLPENGTGEGTQGFFGSPCYVPPEHINPMGHTPDARSDIYSLGATFYEMLTGRPPHEGNHHFEILHNVLYQNVVPVCKVNSKIPVDLSLIIDKCLEKDIHERYSTVHELLMDLQDYASGHPVHGLNLGPFYRLKKYVSRYRGASILGVCSLLIIATLGMMFLNTRIRARKSALLIQEYSAQVERIEWQKRISNKSPRHDTTYDNQLIQRQMDQIEKDSQKYGEIASAPEDYALGLAKLAMNEYDEARIRLEQARTNGVKTPRLYYSLGIVYSELYSMEISRSRFLSPEEKNKRIARADEAYRQPAIAMLQKSKQISGLMEFYSGLLNELKGRDDEAIDLYRLAHRKNPWFYEGKLREARILTAQCSKLLDSGSHDDLPHLFNEIEDLFQSLFKEAPSDVHVYVSYAGFLQLRIELDFRTGKDPQENHRRMIDICNQALFISPSCTEAMGFKANQQWAWAEYLWYSKGKSPKQLLEESITLSNLALKQDHDNSSLHFGVAQALCTLGYYKTEQNINPLSDFQAAADHTGAILEKAPGDYRSIHQMGLIYWMQADYLLSTGQDPTTALKQSEQYYKDAIELKPGISVFINNLGLVYDSLAEYETLGNLEPGNEYEHAIEQYKEAIRIDDYRMARGNLAAALANYAGFLVKKMSKPDPENENRVNAMLSSAEKHLNLLDEVNYRDTELEVTRAGIFLVRAQLALRVGLSPTSFWKKAQTHLEKVTAQYPNSISLFLTWSEVLRLQIQWFTNQKLKPRARTTLVEWNAVVEAMLKLAPDNDRVRAEQGVNQYARYLLKPSSKTLNKAGNLLSDALNRNPLLKHDYQHYVDLIGECSEVENE